MRILSEEGSLSPDLKSHFFDENLRRVKLFGVIVLIIQFVGVTSDLANPPYRILLPCHVGTSAVIVIGFGLRKVLKSPVMKRGICYAQLWLILLLSTTITILDQFIHGQIAVYVLSVMGVAALFYLPVQLSIPMFTSTFVLFLLGMIAVQPNPNHLYPALFNGTITICFAWAISFFMHRTKVNEFTLRHRQRFHEEKLLSLGTLVSVTAHEINNPNNALLLSLQTINRIWNELTPVHEAYARENGDFEVGGYAYGELKEEMPNLLTGATANSRRIQRIVQDLRCFARKDKADLTEDIHLNHVIEDALSLVRTLIMKRTTHLRLELDKDIPTIKGNRHQLEQVVINLVQNAAQSLESPDRAITLLSSFDRASNRVLLSVVDEGRGMDTKTQDHLFNPFFTTKKEEDGTGLGLAICKRIVDAHGGRIHITSKRSAGTRVDVLLPSHTGGPAHPSR